MSVLKKRKLCSLDTGNINREKTERNDKLYFTSYSDIELHRTMIEDQVRTNSYKNAIFNSPDVIKDKIVADVGCGTGILSIFCAKAGAKKVYAIDASQIANHAERIVKENGLQDIITVIHGKAEDVDLPEKVDVIVSEWMGYMLLFETMLPSVLHIRDKYLKPNGKMFPERAVLHMALGESRWLRKYQEDTYDFWISMIPTYNIDMASLADEAIRKFKEYAHIQMVSMEDVMSKSTVICDLNLYNIKDNDLKCIESAFSMSSMGSRELNCLIVWFDVIFPDGSNLTTAPYFEDTHWQNTLLPLDERRLKQDDEVKGTINIKQHSEYFRYLNITVNYSINGSDNISKCFRVDDEGY